MRSSGPRGSVLVMVLLLVTFLLVIALGFISAKASEFRSVKHELRGAQAKALARAGLEETRAKMLKDYNFPPLSSKDQPVFSLRESILDVDGSTPLGSYEVRIRTESQYHPYKILVIRSTGILGDPREPEARRTLEAWVDYRDEPGNPDYFKVMRIKDLGGT